MSSLWLAWCFGDGFFQSNLMILTVRRLHAVGVPEDVITYAMIREVFDTDVYVDVNDLTGQLNVVPMRGSRNT